MCVSYILAFVPFHVEVGLLIGWSRVISTKQRELSFTFKIIWKYVSINSYRNLFHVSYFYSTWQQSSCLFRILVNIKRKLYILKGKSAFYFEYKLDHLVLTNYLPEIYWTLIFNVEKWTNILKISCSATTQDF